MFISVSVILCRTHVIFTIRWLLAKLLSAWLVLIEGAALFVFKNPGQQYGDIDCVKICKLMIRDC